MGCVWDHDPGQLQGQQRRVSLFSHGALAALTRSAGVVTVVLNVCPPIVRIIGLLDMLGIFRSLIDVSPHFRSSYTISRRPRDSDGADALVLKV